MIRDEKLESSGQLACSRTGLLETFRRPARKPASSPRVTPLRSSTDATFRTLPRASKNAIAAPLFYCELTRISACKSLISRVCTVLHVNKKFFSKLFAAPISTREERTCALFEFAISRFVSYTNRLAGMKKTLALLLLTAASLCAADAPAPLEFKQRERIAFLGNSLGE